MFVSVIGFAQAESIHSLNTAVIDSCLNKIDSSYQMVQITFQNGSNPTFEESFIIGLKKLPHIEYLIEPSNPGVDANGHPTVKGVSIIVYHNSNECSLTSGVFHYDLLTGESSLSITIDHPSYCWSFQPNKPVTPCVF
jgi:hypothetical protein